MERTKFSLSEKPLEAYDGDLLVYCVYQPKKGRLRCEHKAVSMLINRSRAGEEFKGKEGEQLLIYPAMMTGKVALGARRLLIIGLGKKEKESDRNLRRESWRKVGGLAAKAAAKLKAADLAVQVGNDPKLSGRELTECLTEGILLGDYRFLKYKKMSKKDKPFGGIETVRFICSKVTTSLRKGLKSGENGAQAACTARNMANEPGNGWTAADFAAHGRKLAKRTGLKCRVLNRSDMVRLGMGGILAVNQGSEEPPKLVILEYRPSKKAETLLFVGKGLTFDSGGVSLKPAAGMEDMKYDMCGGAAALSVMEAVAAEKPGVGVVAIIPATDNMGGRAAVKPGDIISHYNKLTSEVINTDAEGRLILADALAYGIKRFKPSCVVDLATLTGAVIIGLGHHHSGLLSNNQVLVERLIKAGKRCGEPLWQLPLGPDYSKQLESRVADVKNTGGRAAGTITAACYLEKFVGDTPWAHLDIAGTAWNFTDKSYVPKGPSGTGVRTLLELVRGWKKGGL
ncbi:MAG: leucyl aminopeptidase [Thermodesulfobacteriota bacterium]